MHLFLHISGALNANQSDNVLYIVSSTFKFDKQKMAAKTINARFHVSAWFGVDKFLSHVFRSNWPFFDLQIENGYRENKIIAFLCI